MAIYHLNPHSGSKVRCILIKMTDEDVILTESTRRLDEFRAYLNSHVAEFMDKEDYSSYFNIPFILSVDGDRQEEFKDFFESSWAEGVQADLQASLEDMGQISDEPDSLAEGAGSQLEQMLKFYVRHNAAGGNTEPNTKWEEIEMRAEEAAAGIEKQKHSNKKKTAELNMLANKYEGLKIEYECFLEQIEEKYKTEFTFHNGMLLVESKFRKAALDDREKHEAEAMKNLQKDLGRKLNIQEVRVFKTQYKEKLMNYKLLSYIGSKNSAQVNHTRQMWKRIVFEYAHVAYRLVVGKAGGKGIPIGHGDGDQSIKKRSGVKDVSQKGSKKELPTNKKPVEVEPKEDVEKYEKKMESMEKDFSELEPRLNSSPDVLEKLLQELKIDDLVNFDKQYALEKDYIESCIEITEEDLKRIEVQKQAALIGESENPSEVSKPKIPEEKPKNEADKLEKKVTISELKDNPKFSEDIRERTRISLAVLNQKMAYKEKVHLPKENLFLEQILINTTSMINRLCKINSEVTKDLFLELELSLYFLLHSTRDNELVKARLRKEDYIVNHCKIMYKHVEDHSKALAENNKLKTYTLTLLKLSRLVLEIYRSVPQQLQTIMPVFIHMQTSQDILEVKSELKPDVRAQLASCTAAASKRSGDLQPEDRSGLASFLIEYLSKPIAEKVPPIVEVELEACLISLAAVGVHEKLTEYEKIEVLVDQLENSESLKHTKTAK